MMGNWSHSNPCKNCGKTGGLMVKCSNCGTLGCSINFKCVGGTGRGHCGVCKKNVDRIKV